MAVKGRDVTIGAAGVFAGALVGAGLALLLSPRSGRETRRDIARLGKRTRRQVDEAVGDLSGKVDEAIRAMEGAARDIAGKGRDATAGTARVLRSAVEEGRSALGRRLS